MRQIPLLLFLLSSLCLLGLVTAPALAETTTVRVPLLAEQIEGRYFYTDVAQAALARMPGNPELELVGPVPQARAQSMLAAGTLDLMWMIESADRDERYLTTGVGLTNGLIGQRVLMIRPQDQPLFAGVESLQDFQALGLTAGFGPGWIDSRVWAANDLDFHIEQGNWHVMFDKLKRGRTDYDYLSRSIKEVQLELAAHPELVLEDQLLLQYDRDEVFYVSPHNPDLQHAFVQALQAMAADGALSRLVDLHFGQVMTDLEVDQRTLIELDNP